MPTSSRSRSIASPPTSCTLPKVPTTETTSLVLPERRPVEARWTEPAADAGWVFVYAPGAGSNIDDGFGELASHYFASAGIATHAADNCAKCLGGSTRERKETVFMLAGPYSIRTTGAQLEAIPGVYVLSRDGKTAAYVGRSDADLRSRMLQSAAGAYRHFWFEYASSPRDAYLKECEYYHRYGPPDNINHPAVPPGANWRCPIRGCPWA